MELKKKKIFIAEINVREQMNIVINKYITTPDYTEKTYLPGASSGVSLCSFFIVVGPPVVTAGASISLVFLVGNAINKTLLEIMT